MEEKRTRREFLGDAAALGAGAWLLGACGRSAGAAASAVANMSGVRPSIDNAGIQLYTVRDRMTSDFEGTLAQIAGIGYREVEFVAYGGKSPQEVRAILDRVGLRAPSTHAALRPGPDLEQQLAGYQAMGHKFAAAGGPRRAPGGPPIAAPPDPRAAPPAGAQPNGTPPNGAPGGSPNGGPPAGFTPPVPTLDSVQREIASWNEIAQAAKPYGIRILVHNHTMEFTLLPDGRTPHDVMLAELDPSLVVLELDIGWSTVAGKDAQALIAAHPGRYPLWHVKDMANLAAVNSNGNDEAARMRAAKIVPLGQGEIDYGPIFARAGTAGLEHFFVEQDTAPDSGDSIAAARTSFEALKQLLRS
ncbi:MAG: sugar phosphate isomerase/epimerase family protein [Gemmatimonadaceae bacterium]